MKVKICGIFEEQTLIDLNQNGIWPEYIGFVFAKSRRQIVSDQIKHWLQHIPNHVKTVGVFVNPTMEEVQEAPVEIVQLYGEETPAMCQMIHEQTGKEIWKVISVAVDDSQQNIEEYQRICEDFSNVVDGFIFDTASVNRGGTGIKFSWNPLRNLWKKCSKPILVAGGVTKEDIPTLRTFPIIGIDLSSGVEINGRKSIEKIVELVMEARRDESVETDE
ncbi:hypothetical protein [Tepidibacillus marianensis]|uniref:phosphoribosylanthranilate isomerase n=1 Tax=Tepidibacillus marianensis TaxID=3131995 RepID=UPI0030D0027E